MPRVTSGSLAAQASIPQPVLTRFSETSTTNGSLAAANGHGRVGQILLHPRQLGFTERKESPPPAMFQRSGRPPWVGSIRQAISGSSAGMTAGFRMAASSTTSGSINPEEAVPQLSPL